MRILHLVHTPGPGGTETVVENLLRWQRQSDIDQGVACPPGHLRDTAISMGIPVYTVPFELLRRSPNPLNMINTPRAFTVLKDSIRDAVADFNPSVVHSHSVKATILARYAVGASPAVRLLWHLHDFAPLGHFRRLWIALAKRSADAIAAVSRDVAETVCPDTTVHVVYNALDTRDLIHGKHRHNRSENPANPDAFIFGYLGRLHREKGVLVLLEACGELHHRMKHMRLHIAGEAPASEPFMRAELETRARSLDMGDIVTFMGRIADPSVFYDSIDGFVLPAPREPFGLVILEALSRGCPVIACDAGGPREILHDFKGSILVPPRDPIRLAGAMEAMIHDSAYSEYAEIKGPAYVNKSFSPEIQAETVRSLYETLLQ